MRIPMIFNLAMALTTGALSFAAFSQTSVDNTSVTETNPDASTANDQVVSKTEINRTNINRGQPGVSASGTVAPANGDSIERTEITEKQTVPSPFRDEAVGVIPQVGFLSFTDPSGTGTSRGVAGLTVDFNLAGRSNTRPGKLFIGPSIGAFYSHLGTPGADFFGANGNGNGTTTASSGNPDTHLVMFPIDAKIGYTYSDIARISFHVGANLMYYTSGASNPFNSNPNGSTGLNTSMNLGPDLEFGIGHSVALLIRPDWTFANSTVFTGTIGLTLPIS